MKGRGRQPPSVLCLTVCVVLWNNSYLDTILCSSYRGREMGCCASRSAQTVPEAQTVPDDGHERSDSHLSAEESTTSRWKNPRDIHAEKKVQVNCPDCPKPQTIDWAQGINYRSLLRGKCLSLDIEYSISDTIEDLEAKLPLEDDVEDTQVQPGPESSADFRETSQSKATSTEARRQPAATHAQKGDARRKRGGTSSKRAADILHASVEDFADRPGHVRMPCANKKRWRCARKGRSDPRLLAADFVPLSTSDVWCRGVHDPAG